MTGAAPRRFLVLGGPAGWQDWVRFHLRSAGAEVVDGLGAGAQPVAEYQFMIECTDVVVVLVDESDPDPVTRAAVEALVALERAVIPVLLVERPLPALLASCVPIRMIGAADADAVTRLLIALRLADGQAASPPAFPSTDGRARQVLARPPDRIGTPPRYAPHDPLPRLQQLHVLAMTDAGQVSTAYLEEGSWRTFDQGLYVRRDAEEQLVRRLTDDAAEVTVVTGEAGTGKTSLLWGVATALSARPGRQTFLLKARWLVSDEGRPPLVEPAMLADALAAAARDGVRCSVLVDTADLLVGDDRTRVALLDVVTAAKGVAATVLVSSRVREARLLPPSWQVERLVGYATDSEGSSEFDRAVAAHARFYCTDLVAAEPLTDQLLGAVTRRQRIGLLARHPLTLRMLFEIYQPAKVPENVDLTELYGQFWDHRVVRDRGNWSSVQDRGPADRDLTATASTLALRMLRAGFPEIAPTRLHTDDTVANRALDEDVDLLCRRGVGVRTAGGGFSFFHQTFFEFAAGHALLLQDPTALTALRTQAAQRPDDFIVLAVLEQAWLWAWRRDHTTGPALTESIAAMSALDDPASRTPSSLERVTLSVLAQSPGVPAELGKALTKRVAAADLTMLKETLALLPPPCRPPGEVDVAVARKCLARSDAAWASVFPMLNRVAQRAPDLVDSVLQDPSLIGRIEQIAEGGKSDHHALLALLGRFSRPGSKAAASLAALCRAAIARGQADYLVSVLDALRPPGHAAEVAALADELLEEHREDGRAGADVRDQHTVLAAHARVHLRAVVEGSEVDWADVVTELAEVVERFTRPGPLPRGTTARLGGLLLALTEYGPGSSASDVVATLQAGDVRRLRPALLRGWFAALVVAHTETHDRVADGLRRGLLTDDPKPDAAARIWADVLRRTLERADVPAAVAARICALAVDDDTDAVPWLDDRRLFRLVVKGAVGAVPGAVAAVTQIAGGREGEAADARRRLVRQSISAPLPLREHRVLVDLLVDAGDTGALWSLVERDGDAVDRWPSGPRVRDVTVAALASGQPTERHSAARLLERLVAGRLVEPPSWQEVTAWARPGTPPPVRAEVVKIALHGLDTGRHTFSEVRALLLGMDVSLPRTEIPQRADSLAARAALVAASASWGDEDDLAMAVDLAFTESVEGRVVADLGNAVHPELRRGHPFPRYRRRHLLIDLGVRLCGEQVGTNARKYASNRLRDAMAVVSGECTAVEQCELAAALARMESQFAAALVRTLSPTRHDTVRTLLIGLLDDDELHADVRQAVRHVLADASAHLGSEGWRSLDDDLRGSPEPAREPGQRC